MSNLPHPGSSPHLKPLVFFYPISCPIIADDLHSLATGSYPQVHGVCSNYWLVGSKGEGIYVESAEYILAETIFQRAQRRGKTSILVTSKDKLHIFGRWRHHHRFIRLAPRVGGVRLR